MKCLRPFNYFVLKIRSQSYLPVCEMFPWSSVLFLNNQHLISCRHSFDKLLFTAKAGVNCHTARNNQSRSRRGQISGGMRTHILHVRTHSLRLLGHASGCASWIHSNTMSIMRWRGSEGTWWIERVAQSVGWAEGLVLYNWMIINANEIVIST